MHALTFAPPVAGLSGNFNTFRLGTAWAKRLEAGDLVGIVNTRKSELVGVAQVTAIEVGEFMAMNALYAMENHNHKHKPREQAVRDLREGMMKRYGPHKLTLTSKVTVIWLSMVNDAVSEGRPEKAAHLG